jgi:hypothetical protein
LVVAYWFLVAGKVHQLLTINYQPICKDGLNNNFAGFILGESQ